jgi:hypothetical protein
MSRVVALTGPKGSGKDTVGMVIRQLYPLYNVRCIAYADPIKKVINELFDLSDGYGEYDLFKRTELKFELNGNPRNISGRHLVREIGMLMRQYDDKQFTKYVRQEIETCNNTIWVVTDMRFDNEYMDLKDLGAKTIKILRPKYHYDGHITERGFDDQLVDNLLMNDGDLDFLQTRVKIVMDKIIEEWRNEAHHGT